MEGVNITLFTGEQQGASIASLITAASAALRAAPAAVSVRRVRDMTFPQTPGILYINPQFAGDTFPARRQLRVLQSSSTGLGAISLDVQATLPTNAAAAALSVAIATAPTLFAESFTRSLVGQGSPLAGAQAGVRVQPYPGTEGAIAGSSTTGTAPLALTAGAAVATIAVLAVCGGLCYRAAQRRNATKIAPSRSGRADTGEDEDAGSQTLGGIHPPHHVQPETSTSTTGTRPTPPPSHQEQQLSGVAKGQGWRAFIREFLTENDVDYLVDLGALDEDGRRVGARKLPANGRSRFSSGVLARLIAFGVVSE